MNIKGLMLGLLVLGLIMSSCGSPQSGLPSSVSSPPPSSHRLVEPTASRLNRADMATRLAAMGGQPCEEVSDFTCVTINVPLDHFDPTNAETIDLVFAIALAPGDRYGMFVQATPGGPGGEGISTSSLKWFSKGILEHYDIVYFDQRGLGLSHPLDCPTAYASYFMGYLNTINQEGLEGYDTPSEQQAIIAKMHTFVDECMAEIGPESTKLGYFTTKQVAEDLEAFRQLIGDEKFMLYGVSYGTAVAQTYAAAHANHLMGMVLDGTMNLTLGGEEMVFSQDKAMDQVLVATLKACDADAACAADLGGDALAVYDDLARRISENPPTYAFPLPSGQKVERTFTFTQLEYTASDQIYSISGRMLFLRALAAAREGDMVPMARLLYQSAGIDPETFTYLSDPTFSDTLFYSVSCTDDAYFSGTPEERVAAIIAAGQASNGAVPRLDGNLYSWIACAYWPGAPSDMVEPAPLVAEGVPTFVLNATLDPATPFDEGKAIFENLADGYHLYVEGGKHSIYGLGLACPDAYISDFLVEGVLPAQREIICKDWGAVVIQAYEPRIPTQARDYANPLDIFTAIDREIGLQPEYFLSTFEADTAVACPFGGSFTFGPGDAGVDFVFDQCAYIQGFVLSGTGSRTQGLFSISAQISGDKTGVLVYTRDATNNNSTSVTGEYGGETISLNRSGEAARAP